MLFSTRETCRSCNSDHLDEIFSFGTMYISSFIDQDAAENYPSVPLEVVLCRKCSLLQLRHSTSPDLLWKHYWYRSGINDMMRSMLAGITARAKATVSLKAGDHVLDIGCNDGTMLRTYGITGLNLVGFEPATNLVDDARKGTTKVINDFFNRKAYLANVGDVKAKVVTTISMFYDLEDPNTFVSDIKECLAEDGVWINQMNYLVAMLEKNVFDNIGHEHLEYYSLKSLEFLLARHELEVFDVELDDLNGGSFRCYIRHTGSYLASVPGAEGRLRAVREKEAQLRLDNREAYDAFAGRAKALRQQLRDLVLGEVAKGKTVYAYGASTRGSMIVQYCGFDSKVIKAAVERSSHKWGKKTTGTWIPIISEEQARKERPDYMLVLPYFFIEEFVQRERAYLTGGGKFIVPLPECRVISA